MNSMNSSERESGETRPLAHERARHRDREEGIYIGMGCSAAGRLCERTSFTLRRSGMKLWCAPATCLRPATRDSPFFGHIDTKLTDIHSQTRAAALKNPKNVLRSDRNLVKKPSDLSTPGICSKQESRNQPETGCDAH